jgi:hypothetical protein
MFEDDQYPVAPEIAQPTPSPIKTAADFIMGEPNCSTIITLAKTLKPRPINFGSPHGRGRGAAVDGQRA